MVEKKQTHRTKDPSKRLLRLREVLGFSQREMADEFGVVHGAIGLWETNKRKIPGPVLKLMALYETELGLSPLQVSPVESKRTSRNLTLAMAGVRATNRVILQGISKIFFNHRASHKIQERTREALAKQIVDACSNLKGLPQKMGQFLSYAHYDLDPAIRESYAKLQDSADPLPEAAMIDVVLEEFKKTPKQLFKNWLSTPLAVGSIGQVYQAKLSSEEDVVVKIQFPGIIDAVNADLKNIALIEKLGGLLMRGAKPIFAAEWSKRFAEESDYTHEAIHQENFNLFFCDDDRIIIPKVYKQYSSAKVITSEFIVGDRFASFVNKASQNQKNKAAEIIWDFVMKSIFVHKTFNADPHPGNYLFKDGKVAFIDFGCVKTLTDEDFKIWYEMLQAIFNEDQDKVADALVQMDSLADKENFDKAHFLELMRKSYKPFWFNGEFEFNNEYLANLWDMVLSDNPNLLKVNMSAEHLFLNQLLCGIFSIMTLLNAKSNWHERIKIYLD